MLRVGIVALALAACSKPQDDAAFQSALSSVVRDPQTTRFSDISQNAESICGQLNTKNAYGAYGGYLVFVYDRKNNALEVERSGESVKANEQLVLKLDLCDNQDEIERTFVEHTAVRS
jgi:hypothetical protein